MSNITPPRCSVRITPGDRILETGRGENLLTLLTENSILLRSDCGGKGVCGKCLVELTGPDGTVHTATACTCTVDENQTVAIPTKSLISPHIINKANVYLPDSFLSSFSGRQDAPANLSIAVDLGTTTIAVYLVNRDRGRIVSSLAVKNPQALYGDDVMSRISYIGGDREKLKRLQHLVTGAVEWGVQSLLTAEKAKFGKPEIVIVGNPAMIHILLGVCPSSIGVAPYAPQFSEARLTPSEQLGMGLGRTEVRTLPHISGFIGGDILAAAAAVELAERPAGTLLIDLGTNGELMLKGKDGFYATSCATGPAFEGATLSCGIQAVPGAVDSIRINENLKPVISTITGHEKNGEKPKGICGSGIISGTAELLRSGIIETSGNFSTTLPVGTITELPGGGRHMVIYADPEGEDVFISQKDIRHVQLGKAALITGIEFLLAAAGFDTPAEIIVAGAFGSHQDKQDLLTLGLLPQVDPKKIIIAGNAAGAGAIMVLCSDQYLEKVTSIAAETTVINLADDMTFHAEFIKRLSF